MAQEFVIKSTDIEDKINQLLPSQGGFQAGVDFSASTMVVPIVDLTETAEGSALRADLQTAISHGSATAFDVTNTTTTVINTTGYYRIVGTAACITIAGTDETLAIKLNDGATDKTVWQMKSPDSGADFPLSESFDLVVFLPAGNSLKVSTNASTCNMSGSVRQIADINGNLVNPS